MTDKEAKFLQAENILLRYLLGENVSYSEFLEFAYARKEVESKITESGEQILEHLIKVLKWDDPVHNEKHLANLTDFTEITEKIVEYASKRPSASMISFWLYFEKREARLDKYIRRLSRKYGSLREYRSNEEVKELLSLIFEWLGKYLFEGKFETMKEFLFDLGIEIASPVSIMRNVNKKMKRGVK